MGEISQTIAEYGAQLFVERWPEIAVLFAMLTIWRWFMGRDLRRKFQQQIDDLKSEWKPPAITQTINYNNGPDREENIRNAVGMATVRNLNETIRALNQHPLEGGHSYAELPNGTNIVTMADGTIRLALPVPIEARESASIHESHEGILRGPDGEVKQISRSDQC